MICYKASRHYWMRSRLDGIPSTKAHSGTVRVFGGEQLLAKLDAKLQSIQA